MQLSFPLGFARVCTALSADLHRLISEGLEVRNLER